MSAGFLRWLAGLLAFMAVLEGLIAHLGAGGERAEWHRLGIAGIFAVVSITVAVLAASSGRKS